MATLKLTDQAIQQPVNLLNHDSWQLIGLHNPVHQISLDKAGQQLQDLSGMFSGQAGQGHRNGLGMFVQQLFGDMTVVHGWLRCNKQTAYFVVKQKLFICTDNRKIMND